MQSIATRQTDLIGRVYDAALDPSRWNGLTRDIAEAFEASGSVVQTRSPTGVVQVVDTTDNLTPETQASYEQYYWKTDVWSIAGLRAGLGKVLIGTEFVSEGDLRRTEFYADWLRKTGQFHVVGSVFDLGLGMIGAIGIHRAESMKAYGANSKRDVTAFLPHLIRGLQLRQQLVSMEEAKRFSLEALERVQMCVFVVGREGRVRFATSPAAKLTQTESALRLLQGRLVARSSSCQKQLAQAVEAAINIAAGHRQNPPRSLKVERPPRAPLALSVQPMRPQEGTLTEPLAFVFVTDPEKGEPPLRALQELFGLTAAEAQVAAKLAAGRSVKDITLEQGLSAHTVRTHVKHLFQKTDTTRQGELVSLILRCCGPGHQPAAPTAGAR